MIWYGKTRTWTPAQSSGLSLSKFLFGEFDAVRGTDIVAVVNSAWSYSSGSLGSWVRFNSKLTSSFANAVAADVDGNGKSDIAFNDDGDWRWSRDGRSPLALLRDDKLDGQFTGYPPLKLLIGTFDGDTRAKVVAFERRSASITNFALRNVPGERLMIWSGVESRVVPWASFRHFSWRAEAGREQSRIRPVAVESGTV